MTIQEKRDAMEAYCESQINCETCKAVFDIEDLCWSGSEEHMLANFERVFGEDENPYWERICKLSEKQRAKGMGTYGQGLECNPASMVERIEHLQEELIDALMYCEWMKDKLNELGEKVDD